jgi:membrane protein implicated in regulation of membrane protease activity
MLRGAMTAPSGSPLVLAILATCVSVAVCAVVAIAVRLAIVWTLNHGPMMAVIMFSVPGLLACYLIYRIAKRAGQETRHRRMRTSRG